MEYRLVSRYPYVGAGNSEIHDGCQNKSLVQKIVTVASSWIDPEGRNVGPHLPFDCEKLILGIHHGAFDTTHTSDSLLSNGL